MNEAPARQLIALAMASLIALIAAFGVVFDSDSFGVTFLNGSARQVVAPAHLEQLQAAAVVEPSPVAAQLAAARRVSLDLIDQFYEEKLAAPIGDLPAQF